MLNYEVYCVTLIKGSHNKLETVTKNVHSKLWRQVEHEEFWLYRRHIRNYYNYASWHIVQPEREYFRCQYY